MPTVSTKKICVKCETNPGIVTCDGCHQSFCEHHLSEHRQEVLKEVDRINDDCERLRQSLVQENDPTPLLSAIDVWEQESIKKIQLSAENARKEVHQLTKRTMNDFNEVIDKITASMESSRRARDTTEIDLKNWTRQLQKLQNLLQKPFPISVISDETPQSAIRLINIIYEAPLPSSVQAKVNKRQKSTVKLQSHSSFLETPHTTAEERFHQVAGRVKLSEDGLLATCMGYSSICGIKLYGSEIHNIRFRIIAKKNEGIFFGILASMQKITARATELSSVYGWRDFDRPIVNRNPQLKVYKEKNIEPGDQMTLTIDCDHTELVLTHHRLQRNVQLSVDVDKCPLPWRLLVSSYGEDTICIMG